MGEAETELRPLKQKPSLSVRFAAGRGDVACLGGGEALESKAATISGEMLALGVAIAAFEDHFARAGGDGQPAFHRAWEEAVEAWWRQAEMFESLAADEVPDDARAAHAASVARMVRFG